MRTHLQVLADRIEEKCKTMEDFAEWIKHSGEDYIDMTERKSKFPFYRIVDILNGGYIDVYQETPDTKMKIKLRNKEYSKCMSLLASILDCDEKDLDTLEKNNANLNSVYIHLCIEKKELTYENLVKSLFFKGVVQLKEDIKEKIKTSRKEYGPAAEIMISKIQKLNPVKEMRCDFNYSDSTLYLKHEDIYLEYLTDELIKLHDYIGREFEIDFE